MHALRSFFNPLRLVLYAAFFVALRIGLELWYGGLLRYGLNWSLLFIVLEWLLWYAGTFLMVLSCFRYVAGAGAKSASLALLGAPMLLIPVITAVIIGDPLRLDFLDYREPGVWAAIASLMYLSPYNHAMFYELALAAVTIPIMAYRFSKSAARALATFFVFYAALIFLQGFVYVCANGPRCVVQIGGNPTMVWLGYFAATSFIWLCVFLWPELRRYRLGQAIDPGLKLFLALYVSVLILAGVYALVY